MKHTILLITALLTLPASAVVVFDFGNGSSNGNNSQNGGLGNWTPFSEGDPIGSVSTSIGGIQMTLNGIANDGNATADEAWGINSQGIGIITDGIDGVTGRRVDGSAGEAIVFSFDVDVFLVSVNFGSFANVGGNDESLTLTPDGGSVITFSTADDGGAGNADPQYEWDLGGVLVTAGTEIRLTTDPAQTQDGGILFNEITVNAVPEPSSATLLALSGFGLLVRRRR
ncbi:hypothetical protein NT6N_18990 [Oceaniferula spumae]|uniref:Ice-binding protein C-terminal domain-containing protein n=1 Tax=Oceaniferula spumae TaxID=2979115 RepID=A0AAT9FLP2_9BACT